MPDDTDPSSETFDAHQWLADLQRRGREHQQVVQQRPSADALSDSLGRSVALLADWTDSWRCQAALQRGIDPATDYALYPLASSLAEADITEWEQRVGGFCQERTPSASHWLDTNPTRNPTSWGIAFLARCFNTVLDDFAGVAVLIKTESHIRAPITLSRSVLEAAAVACHIIDPEASQRERLRRVLNLHFEELKETCNADGGDHGASGSSIELRELIAFAESLGFKVRYRPDRWMPPVIAADDRQQPDSARVVVEELLPGVGADMWRSLSAIAHSRDSRTVLPDEYSPSHLVHPWQRTESVAWHTLGPLMVVRELCRRAEAYLGWEFADLIELLDPILHQWSAAGGLYDDQIRANLGLG